MSATVNRRTTRFQMSPFKVVEENITLSNGVTTTVAILKHPGAAAIIPLLDSHTIVMIKQYRHSVGKFIWEIPAGTRDPGETPDRCAERELAEETGYSAGTWHPLGAVTPVPGYSDERIHLFLATDLTRVPQNLDRDELLDVCHVPANDVMEMIVRGDIEDCKTICALHLFENFRKNNPNPTSHAPR